MKDQTRIKQPKLNLVTVGRDFSFPCTHQFKAWIECILLHILLHANLGFAFPQQEWALRGPNHTHIKYTHTSNTHTHQIHTHIKYTHKSNTLTHQIHTHIKYTHKSNTLTHQIHTHIKYTHKSNTFTHQIHTNIKYILHTGCRRDIGCLILDARRRDASHQRRTKRGRKKIWGYK